MPECGNLLIYQRLTMRGRFLFHEESAVRPNREHESRVEEGRWTGTYWTPGSGRIVGKDSGRLARDSGCNRFLIS
jgi:hypothetical protein